MCDICVHILRRAEESNRSPGLEVIGSCEPPDGGHLEGQGLLPVELSLWPQ